MHIAAPLSVGKWDPGEPADHALGRSRCAFLTKMHLLVEGIGNLLTFIITGGQTHETTAIEAVLEHADANLHDGEGSPIEWPLKLACDEGYRADWINAELIELGINPIIPSRLNED